MFDLTTERLILRVITEESINPYLNEIFDLYQSEKIHEFYPDGPMSIKQAREELNFFIKEFKEKKIPCFLILEKENQLLIGICGFSGASRESIDVGYMLLEKYWNRGFATECLIKLLEWGDHHFNLSMIIAYTPSDHFASITVMKKSGMIYKETKISPIYHVICDYYVWNILKKDIFNR